MGSGTVYVDGVRVGDLIGGRQRTLYVLPGEHWVSVGIGVRPPAFQKVSLALGEQIHLDCGLSHSRSIPWSGSRKLLMFFSIMSTLFTCLVVFIPLLMMQGFDWVHRFFAYCQLPVYWLVYYAPFLDRFFVFLGEQLPGRGGSQLASALLSIVIMSGLLSAFVAWICVHFTRNRLIKDIYLTPGLLRHTVPTDPLAFEIGESAPALTNECVLAAIKARESRPVRTRRSWERLESETATVDDQ